MNCHSLSQAASDWIVSYLNHLSQSSQSIARYWSSQNREQHFRRFGLANLYVPELKAIGMRIESSRVEGHNFPDWVKPKASTKKADWIISLHLFFGGTDDVTLTFLSRRDWTTSNSSVAPDWSNNNNSTESSSASGASDKIIKQQIISATSASSMAKVSTGLADQNKKRPLSKITPESNCIENRQTKKACDATTVWIDLSTAAGEAAANRMWPKGRIRIKQEKTVCSPNQPQHNQAIEENRLLFPRNQKEFSMISHMRVMGFTNDQEILAGLRHVEQQRDPMELSLGLFSMGQHLDAALIWIVNQREEAEEAKKLDEGRLASEMAMVEEHRQEMKNDMIRMQEASLDDILGCEENEHGVSMPSSWFPFSVVLQSSEISAALRSVLLDKKNLDARKLVMNYLQLEAKARKWYGTVVPWCYFHYLQVPNKLADSAEEWLKAKNDELKHGMYTLAEQEENGVGAVPRIFLAAQRKCAEQGLPDRPPSCSINNTEDDDVVILS